MYYVSNSLYEIGLIGEIGDISSIASYNLFDCMSKNGMQVSIRLFISLSLFQSFLLLIVTISYYYIYMFTQEGFSFVEEFIMKYSIL